MYYTLSQIIVGRGQMTNKQKLDALQKNIATWRAETDEISDLRFGDRSEQDEAALFFFAQLNRAELIIHCLTEIEGEKAFKVRRAFEFLVENVRASGRAPREVLTLCQDALAA
jgi:hypothetical protein